MLQPESQQPLFKAKTAKKWLEVIGVPIVFSLGIFALWEMIVLAFNIPAYLLPAPSMIFTELATSFGSLLGHIGLTMLEATAGYAIGNAMGFGLAILFAHSKYIEKGLYPYAIALKTTPIIAMAPLLVLWLGTGFESKVATAALICFFPIIVNTVKGLHSVDSDAIDLFRSYRANRFQVFTKLSLPIALPYVFSALKIATGLSVVGAVVGEFVGANEGIGYVILVSSYHLETVTMFAAIIVSALGGIAFFAVVSLLEKRIIYWQKGIETT